MICGAEGDAVIPSVSEESPKLLLKVWGPSTRFARSG